MIKLFTHTDLDGVGCAILSKLAFGDEVDIEYCGYDDIDARVWEFISMDTVDEFDSVYITDISIKNEDTIKVINESLASKFRLFDHHKTAEHLNKYDWCNVTIKRNGIKTCGVDLFYEWLMACGHIHDSKAMRKFVGAVTAYDTWAWKDAVVPAWGKTVKEFNDLLYILGRDNFIDRCLTRLRGYKYTTDFSKMERELLDRRQAEIDAYIDKKEKEFNVVCLGDKKGMVVFADIFISELGNTLCERHPIYDFIAIIDLDAGKVSYRTTIENMDVSEIAKVYGGGGHKASAGHTFDAALQEEIIRYIFFRHLGIDLSQCKDVTPQPKKSFLDRLRGK